MIMVRAMKWLDDIIPDAPYAITEQYLLLFWFQVRIQLGEGSAGQVTRNMLANEGVRSFYKVCLIFLGVP